MKRIVILLLAISLPAMAADSQLVGNWKLESDVAGTTRVSTCTFIQDGANVKGICKRDDTTTLFAGTIDDKGVHMKAKSDFAGTPIDLTYEAKFVDDRTIKGSIDVQPFSVQGTFTLSKQ